MSKGIQKIYREVPRTYELVNHVLTLGFDMRWRKKAAKFAGAKGGAMWLDVCTGTGEMAVNLAELATGGTKVFGVDFSVPMVGVAAGKNGAGSILFSIADIQRLPFPDNTFDIITISFATRNINKNREFLTMCLREFRRVLRPGGHFVNLETSQPKSHVLRMIFHLYIRLFVSRVGGRISGSKSGYRYLSSTIPRFYGAGEFEDIIKEAGFESTGYEPMTLGAAAIHAGVKPI